LPAILLAGFLSACGQYDQGPCSSRKSVDYTFAVSDTDFQSFVHDDGELDETECAALCDCLSPVPLNWTPGADATSQADAVEVDGGEVDAGAGGAGGTSADGGVGGPRCFAERDTRFTHWESCTSRGSAAGYRLVRCAGTTTTLCR
jgi:hypothetical protein